jgi:catechol 2,3-dioxygenase-like lactoylglutathione lyase family enzyme
MRKGANTVREERMLSDHDAMATIAVRDLAAARRFYEGTLGFSPAEDPDENVAVYDSGGAKLLLYKSEYAGTNEATSATWGVGDAFDGIVETLQGKGVKFERYDFPGMKREGDVHIQGGFKAAWFRDPDGNILHVNNM